MERAAGSGVGVMMRVVVGGCYNESRKGIHKIFWKYQDRALKIIFSLR